MANKKKTLTRKQRLKRHLISHKKHILVLLATLITIFVLFEMGLFIYKNFNELVFPQLPRNQLSPKQIISEQNSKIPTIIPPIIEHGSRYQYKVALTFDADMTVAMQKMLKLGIVKSWYNQEIKQTLDRENAKATIFFTGLWVETYPKEAKELASDPLIEIGNHSYSHPAFTKNCFRLPFIDDSKDKNEVLSAQQVIKRVTGITPKYFRFPGGCFDKNDLVTVNNLGLKVIHWDVTSADGFNKNPSSIIQTIEPRVQNGSIIVFHLQGGTFAPKTNEALIQIIPYLKKRGYQLVTISELLNETSSSTTPSP